MKLLYPLRRLRFYFRYYILSHFSVITFLICRTTDWNLRYDDWPRVYHLGEFKAPILCSDGNFHEFAKYYGSGAHYTCCVHRFWVSGRGRGRTAMEAAKRAIRNMDRKEKPQRMTNEELEQVGL